MSTERGRAYRRHVEDKKKSQVRRRHFRNTPDDPTPHQVGIAARTPDPCGRCSLCAPHKCGWEDPRKPADRRADVSAREMLREVTR